MINSKQKMSASYKAVFVFTIFMLFIVLIVGSTTKVKSSGFGVWIWGYTAWLMYKRRITELVSLYKLLIWIDVFASAVLISVMLFSDNESTNLSGYSPLSLVLLLSIILTLTFSLYKYFKSLENNPLNEEDESALWEQVSNELKNGQRIDSLWTRAFSEAEGDSNKANARYIKLRIEQLSNLGQSTSSTNISEIPNNLNHKLNRKTNLTILSAVSIGLISYFLFFKSDDNLFVKQTKVNSYLGLNLDSSMEEVKYNLGNPSAVLFKDEKPIKLHDGSILNWTWIQATDTEIAKKNGVNNFFYWHFNLPDYRIDVQFDSSSKKLVSIGCYSSDSSVHKPKVCSVLGVNINDDESVVKQKLGNPSKEDFSGVTKTIFYPELNLKFLFVKKRLYYIVVDKNANLSDSTSSKPSYDDEGWTQESTGSKEIGPWLKYSPKGTRYCRYSDGVIQRLYPPGVKPDADKANPFCLGESSDTP